MSDDVLKNGEEENFKQLNKLIRQAGERNDTSDMRPSEETIHACLQENATVAQLNEVQSALLGSSAFRKEFKQMIADFQTMTSLADDPVFQNSETILPHALKQKLREEYPEKGPSFLTRVLKTLTSSRLTQLGIVGAAAAVTLMMVSNPSPVEMNWDAPSISVEKGELVSINTRGVTGVISTFDTAQNAALAGFRKLGSLDIYAEHESFVPTAFEPPSITDNWFGPMKKISITDENDNNLGAIWVNMNEIGTDGVTELQFWFLDIPTRKLHSSELADLDHPIQLNRALTKPMLLTITYRLDGKYRSAGGLHIR